MIKLGKLLVSFQPGEVVGRYTQGEEELKIIAGALGDITDRVFDMYFEFSRLADEGILVREEKIYGRRNMRVSFYYPGALSVSTVRQVIINKLLDEYLHLPDYPRPGIYVVQNKRKDLSLLCRTLGKTVCRA
ncbi:hypothetical protein [Desulforamulus aeronauticus]|uniref:Uncharacterized protein n=1 Tax=Desulforamulus aeronauticus DSM 10349 TaxID=1121421 RepID=A0A1M6S1X3_9FIRM|nr:hypothetical protein [Desulforamulus aeronauticus]SHK38508.1 hypothetical protein SAMN02745123_01673 [Desulforamulus aeronauticus DSM 10349]